MKIIKVNKDTNNIDVLYDGDLLKTNKDKYDLLISDNFKHYFPMWMINYIDDVKKGIFDMKQLDDESYKSFFDYMEDEWLLDDLDINDILLELSNEKYEYKVVY